MANRYWVGGTASWDATAGTKWALTSGGAGGQAVPIASDDVFFDAASGAVTVTVGSGIDATCRSLNFTGFTGTFTSHASASSIQMGDGTRGDLTLVSGMTWSFAKQFVLRSTTTGNQFTFAGKTFTADFNVADNSSDTPTYIFQDAFLSTSTLTVTRGTLNTNGQNVTCASLVSGGTTNKTLTLGASTLTLTGTGTVMNISGSNLTVTASTSNIVISDTSSTGKTFAGNGNTFNNVTITGGASSGRVTFTGANTFATIFIGASSTVRFPAATTTTISGMLTLGSGVTIDSSSAGSAATLSAASGTIAVGGVSLQDSTATGGATFYAIVSTDVSGNTGWLFKSSRPGAMFSVFD